MTMQDPLSDMLTRIRNAQQVNKVNVKMPSSTLKVSVAQVLVAEGYVASFDVSEGVKPELTIELKYFEGKAVIAEIDRISRPGLRNYTGKDGIPCGSFGRNKQNLVNQPACQLQNYQRIPQPTNDQLYRCNYTNNS